MPLTEARIWGQEAGESGVEGAERRNDTKSLYLCVMPMSQGDRINVQRVVSALFVRHKALIRYEDSTLTPPVS